MAKKRNAGSYYGNTPEKIRRQRANISVFKAFRQVGWYVML